MSKCLLLGLEGGRWDLLSLPAALPLPSLPSRPSSRSPEEAGSHSLRAPELSRAFLGPFPQFHADPAGRGCARSCDTQGFLHRQNSGLGLALGTEEADLGPLPLLPPAILRGRSEPGIPNQETGVREAELAGENIHASALHPLCQSQASHAQEPGSNQPGRALASALLKSLPNDSSAQPGLRTSPPREATRYRW